MSMNFYERCLILFNIGTRNMFPTKKSDHAILFYIFFLVISVSYHELILPEWYPRPAEEAEPLAVIAYQLLVLEEAPLPEARIDVEMTEITLIILL